MMDSPTIIALATPPGIGAIGVIRLSGPGAILLTDLVFKGKKLAKQPSHTIHFGHIIDPENNSAIIDEVVVSLYRNPRSYTGEDVVEIGCHGSPYILQQVVDACIRAGAVPAKPGEFTQRAFLNGKLDLTQAEAVADLIASQSSSAQKAAMHNLRGGFSKELKAMREQLITFSALIELELDFSEEDVEFADRGQLVTLIARMTASTTGLIQSFRLGNVVKNGVSVAIVGKPNAGKSTLLNALLNEERAIVSDIAGTTRDTIEEVMNINGVLFRLIDTAGIRESKGDVIEDIGIARSRANAEKADIIIHLIDKTDNGEPADGWLAPFADKTIAVYNKMDIWNDEMNRAAIVVDLAAGIHISSKSEEDIATLKEILFERVSAGGISTEDTIITNARHYAALQQVLSSLQDIKAGMESGISGDLLSLDIRRALHYIGEITGEVQTDRDILGTIFGKFCIGK